MTDSHRNYYIFYFITLRHLHPQESSSGSFFLCWFLASSRVEFQRYFFWILSAGTWLSIGHGFECCLHLLKADRWPQLPSTTAGSLGYLVQNWVLHFRTQISWVGFLLQHSQISTLRSALSDQHSQISTLRSAFSDQQLSQILRSVLSDQLSQISTLRQISTLSDQHSQISISNLRSSQISTLRSALSDQQSQISTLKSAISDHSQSVKWALSDRNWVLHLALRYQIWVPSSALSDQNWMLHLTHSDHWTEYH